MSATESSRHAANESSSLLDQFALVAETCAIGAAYIVTSAGLITFNKFLMQQDRFPHAVHLTMAHMAVTFVLSLSLYFVAPRLYPSMAKATCEWTTLVKYIAPLGFLFALSLYASNQAYAYSSVAFLQFCKEGNIAIVFAMSCCLGLQNFSWMKTAVLSVVVIGCSLCANGEINFVLVGFLLQIFSQVCECSKNLIGEIVMSGAGMKLDVLTFVLFQAPCSLAPLLVAGAYEWEPAVGRDFMQMWPYLLANASIAFFLNILIALTIKRLSALAFVIIGLVKDSVIVASSALIFHDPIAQQQKIGFVIIMAGIAMWSRLKMREASSARRERAPLISRKQPEVKV